MIAIAPRACRTFTSIAAGLVLLALVLAIPAHAAEWQVGAHTGLVYIRGTPGTGTSTVLAWPASAFTYQPGLRVSLGGSRRRYEVQLDTGFFFLDEAGTSYSLFNASAGLQRAFGNGRTSPYVNACVGLNREGGSARSSTSKVFGGGVGVRRIVDDRHGALRAEMRVDRLPRDDTFGRPTLTMLVLRLGFDLWL